jgi:hypothetical protein
MPAIVWQDVVALQPSLSEVSIAAQMIILAHVNEDLDPAAFGGDGSARYHLARVYRAAHLGEMNLRMANGGGAGGEVSSETIGTSAITLSYAAGGSGDDSFRETAWGRAYLTLLDESPLRIGLSTGPR